MGAGGATRVHARAHLVTASANKLRAQVYKKLERELHEKKREMASVIDVSNIAYEARDQARSPGQWFAGCGGCLTCVCCDRSHLRRHKTKSPRCARSQTRNKRFLRPNTARCAPADACPAVWHACAMSHVYALPSWGASSRRTAARVSKRFAQKLRRYTSTVSKRTRSAKRCIHLRACMRPSSGAEHMP